MVILKVGDLNFMVCNIMLQFPKRNVTQFLILWSFGIEAMQYFSLERRKVDLSCETKKDFRLFKKTYCEFQQEQPVTNCRYKFDQIWQLWQKSLATCKSRPLKIMATSLADQVAITVHRGCVHDAQRPELASPARICAVELFANWQRCAREVSVEEP